MGIAAIRAAVETVLIRATDAGKNCRLQASTQAIDLGLGQSLRLNKPIIPNYTVTLNDRTTTTIPAERVCGKGGTSAERVEELFIAIA